MAASSFPALEAERRGPVWWSNVEKAIHTFVTRTLGLDDDRVLWEQQGVTRPPMPFVTLLRGAVVSEGGIDERRHQYDDSTGTVEQRTLQNRAVTISFKAQTDPNCGPDDDAMALVERLRAALYTEAGRAILDEGGLSVIAEETVTDISIVINSNWVTRGLLDVRFRVWSITSEEIDFIETVQAESVGLAPPISIEIDSAAS